VSGEYSDVGSVLDADGWFATKDVASIDDDGYLFIVGRADDTIIRGGENIAPAEIEDVLRDHPGIVDAAVVGEPDDEWGERLVAVVVPRAGNKIESDSLRGWLRQRVRGSRTPDRVVIRDALPYTATGKLLRRELIASLGDAEGHQAGDMPAPRGTRADTE
jgi:acyl-CoA synthetase (AMP-forming)/AMP-acid ligase II